jgi:hypothetical protein
MQKPAAALQDYLLSYFPKAKKALRGVKTSSRAAKVLADTYLEFTFGWKPLAADILSASQALWAIAQRPPVVRIYASASDTYGGADNLSAFPGSGQYYTLMIPSKNYGTYSIRYEGGVNLNVGIDGIPNRMEAFGITLPDFIPTVWDLLPYSFIVDYFLNVGDVITAYCGPRIDLSWGFKVSHDVFTTIYGNVIFVEVGGPGSHLGKADVLSQYCSGGSGYFQTKTFSRTSLSAEDFMPSIQLSLPRSFKPLQNLAAILLSRSLSISKTF